MADIDRLNEIIEPEAKALGFDLVRVKMMPSEAGDGGQALQPFAEHALENKVVVRAFDGDGVRVTVSTPDENDVFLAAASSFPR